MKAAIIERQGGLENIVYGDWPDPVPGPGKVLIKVGAAALNHLDIFVRRGMPGFPVPMPFISGGDMAGTIAGLGEGVTQWKIGDRVAVNPSTPDGMVGEQVLGGLAELVVIPATHCIKLADNIPFDVAAAVPIAYGTAFRMLTVIAPVEEGQLVLVLGASGGVGVASMQVAQMRGAKVIAVTSSAEKAKQLKELGADHVIDSSVSDFSKEAWAISGKKGVDVVVNFTGGDTWNPSIKALKKRGRLVCCGATAGFDAQTDLRYFWVREIQLMGSNSYSQANISGALDMVAAGKLKPPISARLPLSEIQEAERLMETRAFVGKIVLIP